jgi:ribonuclease HI
MKAAPLVMPPNPIRPPLKIYFDGGCRPNPGMIETAVVACGRESIRRDVGYGNSMDAEWLALIDALILAQSLASEGYVLLGDAAAVIAQASGEARCPPSAVRHFEAYRAQIGADARPRLRYIKRTQNLAGIALARLHPR